MEDDVHNQFKLIETDIKVVKALLWVLHKLTPHDIESMHNDKTLQMLLECLDDNTRVLRLNAVRLRETCSPEIGDDNGK